MTTDTPKSRPSVREILEGKNLQGKQAGGLTADHLVEVMGSFSGVPASVYRLAAEADKWLDENVINKIRLCKRSTERVFANRYEQVVLALALGLDDRGRKIHRAYDTDVGCIMEVKLPLNIILMFAALGEGLLRFQIRDEGPSSTMVRAESEVIGIALLRQDWGYGRRNMNAALDKADEHLRRLSGG